MPSRRVDVTVDAAALDAHPLPPIAGETDKYARGTVVIIGAAAETPGAALLAGVAAMRCGAGKLQIVTVTETAPAMAIAVPEARVVGLPSRDGHVDPSRIDDCAVLLQQADAVLVGTGMSDPGVATEIVDAVSAHTNERTTVIVDAAALAALPFDGRAASRTVAMPNPTEAAHALALDVKEVERDLPGTLDALIDAFRCHVTLRDATTWSGGPGTDRFVDRAGHPALASSGSGDVLAGMLAGLAARGTDPLAAMLWANHAHGNAGMSAAQTVGGVGVLAREIVDAIPAVLRTLARA